MTTTEITIAKPMRVRADTFLAEFRKGTDAQAAADAAGVPIEKLKAKSKRDLVFCAQLLDAIEHRPRSRRRTKVERIAALAEMYLTPPDLARLVEELPRPAKRSGGHPPVGEEKTAPMERDCATGGTPSARKSELSEVPPVREIRGVTGSFHRAGGLRRMVRVGRRAA